MTEAQTNGLFAVAGAAVTAFGGIVVAWLNRSKVEVPPLSPPPQPALAAAQAYQMDLKGHWMTTWISDGEESEELLVIEEQVGPTLRGVRTYGKYRLIFHGYLSGSAVGSTVVGYYHDPEGRAEYALSVLFRVSGDGSRMEGRIMWPDEAAKGILSAGSAEYRKVKSIVEKSA